MISIAKTTAKIIRALIRSLMKFLSPEVALYLYKSIVQACMEYCCHIQAAAPSCYLELLDKLKNGYAGLLVLHSLPLLNHWIIVEMELGLVFSVGNSLVGVHLNWLNWFHFLILEGGLLFILIGCMIFMSPFLDILRIPMSTVSFFTQPESGILCLQNAFLCLVILVALSLE